MDNLVKINEYKELANFITEEHFNHGKDINNKSNKYSLIFRACGEYSLARLKDGAGAKPHDILDKSVKPSSESAAEIEELTSKLANQTISKPEQARLNALLLEQETLELAKGFVGYWAKDKCIGVYAAEKWMVWAKAANILNEEPIGLRVFSSGEVKVFTFKDGYFRISLKEFAELISMLKLAAIPNFEPKELFAYVKEGEKPQGHALFEENDELKDANGYIGKWKKNLLGIYMTDYGNRMLSNENEYGKYIKKTKPNKMRERYYFRLTADDSEELDRGAVKAFRQCIEQGLTYCFFAGDYDLMDHAEGRFPLIESTYGFGRFEERMQRMFSTCLQNTDNLAEEELADYNLIQHGAQSGFLAYVLNNETPKIEMQNKRGKLLEVVAGIEFPLLALRGNQWYRINNLDGYKEFCEAGGYQPKNRWMDQSKSAYDKLARLAALYGRRLLCLDKHGNAIPFESPLPEEP